VLAIVVTGCGSRAASSSPPPLSPGSAKRVGEHAAAVTTADVERKGIWRYEVRSGALRLIDGGAPPTDARLSVKLTTRNLSRRPFDVSTTIDLRGDLRAHVRRSAFVDGKCPTAARNGIWCVVQLEGLPSHNQPLSVGETVNRSYVFAPAELDALLADGLRPQDVRLYARDVRIR
jgi:hypothetical protein